MKEEEDEEQIRQDVEAWGKFLETTLRPTVTDLTNKLQAKGCCCQQDGKTRSMIGGEVKYDPKCNNFLMVRCHLNCSFSFTFDYKKRQIEVSTSVGNSRQSFSLSAVTKEKLEEILQEFLVSVRQSLTI